VSFRRFNYTPGLGPDDSVIFNILLSKVLLHPFQSFISGLIADLQSSLHQMVLWF